MKARVTIAGEISFVQESEWTIRIRTGRDFTIEMLDPVSPDDRWVTSKDPVLQVNDSMFNANIINVSTLTPGISEVQLQTAARDLRFYLVIDVFDPNEAQSFFMPVGKTEGLT